MKLKNFVKNYSNMKSGSRKNVKKSAGRSHLLKSKKYGMTQKTWRARVEQVAAEESTHEKVKE